MKYALEASRQSKISPNFSGVKLVFSGRSKSRSAYQFKNVPDISINPFVTFVTFFFELLPMGCLNKP